MDRYCQHYPEGTSKLRNSGSNEQSHSKSSNVACDNKKDTYQPAYLHNMISVFAVRTNNRLL